MKAYIIHDKDYYLSYSEVVFAETRGKAIADALGLEIFEGYFFTDLRAKREPALDKHYRGHWCMDWDNPQDRLALVRELDLSCAEDFFDPADCATCIAADFCSRYESYLIEEKDGDGDAEN